MWSSIIVFFFKLKTAFYMRISDWSSDVCSSDLLIFGDPAAVELIGEDLLPGLVEHVEDQVLAEIGERRLGPRARAEIPDLVRPLLEIAVVGDAAFQGDRLVLGAAGRLAAGRGTAAFAILDHLGCPLHHPAIPHPVALAAVPLTDDLA